MSEKLGIYLVQSETSVNRQKMLSLVIAESANAAAEAVAFQTDRSFEQVEQEGGGVGRLGTYDPGIEGHRMVAQLFSRHPTANSIIVARENLDAPAV